MTESHLAGFDHLFDEVDRRQEKSVPLHSEQFLSIMLGLCHLLANRQASFLDRQRYHVEIYQRGYNPLLFVSNSASRKFLTSLRSQRLFKIL